MRFLWAVSLLSLAAGFACRSARAVDSPDCGPPDAPSVPPQHTIRHGQSLDTAYARAGLARFVFHVRSAGPSHLDRPLSSPVVYLYDSLGTTRVHPTQRGDSTGIVRLDSVASRHMTARVLGLGYVSRTFSVIARAGYSDTIHVRLAEARLCLLSRKAAFTVRLQN